MTKKPSILILGADGFLGSSLTYSLAKDKRYNIRAFDLFPDGTSKNLEPLSNKIEIFPGNFLNKDDLRRALEGIDYVFHFISLTTPGSSMEDPLIDIDTNIRGTVQLLEECVRAKVKKFIFPSSGGAIYGDQDKESYHEDLPLHPISPYAISKLTIEKYLEYYRIHKNLDYLILRFPNPYGPRQNIAGRQGVIPIFLNQIINGAPITIYGDGENLRDYIYIDDAVENAKKLAFKEKNRHRVYNIGSSEGATINEIVEKIKKITGEKVKIKRLPARNCDIRRIVLDTTRIQEEIDYTLNTSLEEGIKKTWKWVKKI